MENEGPGLITCRSSDRCQAIQDSAVVSLVIDVTSVETLFVCELIPGEQSLFNGGLYP